MNQFKRVQVIMLPSKKMLDAYKAPITKVYEDDGKLYLNKKERGEFITEIGQPQHLYFILDDEIKDGDWCYHKASKEVIKYPKEGFPKKHTNKIIATTDTLLTIKNYCDCGATTYEGCSQCLQLLPQPSEQFIEKYIESYNKGEVITDVLVEYENIQTTSKENYQYSNGNSNLRYEDKPKVNTKNNTITIKKLKDSWNREEVKQLLWKAYVAEYPKMSPDDIADKVIPKFNKWIEENL